MAGITDAPCRELSQMEQIMDEIQQKKDLAWSVAQRVKAIRESLLGLGVPSPPGTAGKEASPIGALGCLSANLRGSTEAFNALSLELEQIEKALGL